MDDLTQRRLEDFLDDVARRTPTPGGGSVTAAAAALASVLAQMVAAYSVGPKTDAEAAKRVETCAGRLRTADQILRALITQDASAYQALSDAFKARKVGNVDDAAFARAVLDAVAVPMEVAVVSTSLLGSLDEFKTLAGRHLISDLGIAAALAEAAVTAARFTVLVNLPQVSDPAVQRKLGDDISQITERAGRYGDSIRRFVTGRLQPQSAPGR